MHLFQVGAGSGGIVALDLLIRDPRISKVTLVEPDTYELHNVHRHAFPRSAVGRLKVELAAEWVWERRPELVVEMVAADLTDPAMLLTFEAAAGNCDIGVCAVDNEVAKYAFDSLMRKARKCWTLGEVLSGGIGGWIHRFSPAGACYGCVASHLQRTVVEQPRDDPPPDYSNPGGPVAETTVPASKASIEVIAAMHASMTLGLIGGAEPDFTSLLFTLSRVSGVFEEAFRAYRFNIPKSASCLICSAVPGPSSGEALDVALDQALARLGNE